MSGFGSTPTTQSQGSLATNQIPISQVAVPGHAGGNLTAMEGGPASTDSNGNETAPVSSYIKDGGDVAQGLTTDAAVTSDANGTVSGKLRGLVKIIASAWDSVHGRLIVDGSQVTQPVSGSVSVSNFPGSQPVSGTVTANAGTNLNTSALALESGGHLASIDSHVPALGQALAAASVPVVLTAAQITTLTPPAAITGFALEAGHLATIDTSTSAANTAIGAQGDAAWSGSGSGSAIAILKKVEALLAATLAVSGTVTANQGGSWTVAANSYDQTQAGFIFKPVKNVAVTAGTPVSIWTPTTGKKFRLMGVYLNTSNAISGTAILLLDGNSDSNEFFRLSRAQTNNIGTSAVDLWPGGYLSTAINTSLYLDVVGNSSSVVEGTVWGYEL